MNFLNLHKFLITNLIAFIGYITFVIYFCLFYFGTIIHSLTKNPMQNIVSAKTFLIFICLYIIELLLKKFLNIFEIFRLENFQKIFSPKLYNTFLYSGIWLYISSLVFDINPSITIVSYFIIPFVSLLYLTITNNNFGVHKYYTINSLIWSSILFQLFLILYTTTILLLQPALGIDGFECFLVILISLFLYVLFIFIILIHLIAIFIEFILRITTKKIYKYNIVNSNIIFKFIVYLSSILLTTFVGFSVYIIIEAFKNID